MRVVVILLVLLINTEYFSQISFGKNPFDLGVITAAGSDFVDIPVKNNGKEKVFIFRTDADKRFQIFYSSKTLHPDSTIYIRILFTPDKKGTINEKVKVHFSHLEDPVSLILEGYCEEIPSSTAISCPSFDQQNINTSLEHDFTVMVVDELTNEPISNADVSFIQNGLKTKEVYTNKNGQYSEKLNLGYYYFIAKHEDYNSNELGAYVNRKNNLIVIPLGQKDPILAEVPHDEFETEIEVISEPPTTPIKPPTDSIENTDNYVELYPDFPLSEYKPNNIVFLLDVSSSMNLAGKIDLLKGSMIEMTKMLRPIDKITLVAYASSAKVIMETEYADNVDTLISIIQELKPQGMTAGGKGMELAYSRACNAFIPEGNNQIIMATDGAFNTGAENVNKLAKKYQKKGVTVSVIGIKNRDFHEESMQQLSIDGGGNYINIQNYEQAQQTLINEIREQSRIMP